MFDRPTLLAMSGCDRCGDDLDLHERMVMVFNLSLETPRARALMHEQTSLPALLRAGAEVEGFEVVGCDRQLRTWLLWAAKRERPVEGRDFLHFGDERTVRSFYSGAGEPTEVELTEDPDGMYWGWIGCDRKTGHKGTPVMIQPREAQFRIQEPGGFHGKVEQGYGEVVRLSVKAKV
ncbi:hypothetical protein [Micromonospora chalcea]|uniref:hypothetical protein n=1 Tax=Micromonospora chalcea TaxID=1874 RepID=UPI003D758240